MGHALRRRYGRASLIEKVCPVGSRLGTVLFPRPAFSVTKAKAWAKRYGLKYGDVDVKDNFIHLRQEEPSTFRRMRTIHLGKHGVEGVVGWTEC